MKKPQKLTTAKFITNMKLFNYTENVYCCYPGLPQDKLFVYIWEGVSGGLR